MVTQNKRLTGILIIAGLVLLIPLIAMQFTSGVKWKALDFVVAGILLFGVGLMFEFAFRKVEKLTHRIAIGGVILASFLLVWAELAVGIFGTPFAGS